MTTIDEKLLFPALAWVRGVKQVRDASNAHGRAALDVEFIDGVTVTVTRDDISRDHFCIWFPRAAETPGMATCAPKLARDEVMAKLSDLAMAANQEQ